MPRMTMGIAMFMLASDLIPAIVIYTIVFLLDKFIIKSSVFYNKRTIAGWVATSTVSMMIYPVILGIDPLYISRVLEALLPNVQQYRVDRLGTFLYELLIVFIWYGIFIGIRGLVARILAAPRAAREG